MTDIADIAFAQVSEEEKKRFEGKIKEEGSWMGYKLRQFWVSGLDWIGILQTHLSYTRQTIDNGAPDQIEHYNSKPRLRAIGPKMPIDLNPSAPAHIPAATSRSAATLLTGVVGLL